MSFVGYGDVLASPNFSGNAGSTFNFSQSGLSNYTLNPTVSYAGGFSQFTIKNLNHQEFAIQMRKPVNPKLAQYFHRLGWPKEMVDLLLIHSSTCRSTTRNNSFAPFARSATLRPIHAHQNSATSLTAKGLPMKTARLAG
ncbi:hypothetical protein [Bradyrhizobium liaoningense]|uniref:hypothetical protein n=1 Tax=Bradyrhizobium liaoningense TaxID=43992 RepID=UPI001BA99B76|nr:hypothetical protein [Bradyrhizobium liaoningense]MBR1029376.1 hypothetical protein [Bradyrhizobium liaoningense]